MLEPGTIYWECLEPIWGAVSIYDGGERFLSEFSQLSAHEKTLFAAHWCQSEVCNGGLHQFFTNSTGVLAPEAATAFDELGLPEGARVIREAMAFFGESYPREGEERSAALRAFAREHEPDWDPFAQLDDAFYAVIDWEQNIFANAADAYAAQHASGLQ